MEEGERTEPTQAPIEVGKGGGRNLRVRIVTGLLLAGIVIGTLLYSATAFFVLAFVVLMVAQVEFYSAVRKAGFKPATILGLTAGATMLIGVFARGEGAVPLVIFLTFVFTFIWFLGSKPLSEVVRNLSVTLFGVLYVPLLGSFAGLLVTRGDGRAVVLAAIAAAALYDTFAYGFGSTIGKRLLAASVSPHKTIEGAVAATLLLAAVGPPLIIWLGLGPWSYLEALGFVAMISIAAPAGDLFESMLKRDLGIKDMGTIFPGHGGALDRVDAILFAMPMTYLSLRLFGL
jgi:phosphatidate cytidylyltransferase